MWVEWFALLVVADATVEPEAVDDMWEPPPAAAAAADDAFK